MPAFEKFAAPCMERRDPALVVPMPTLPSCFTLKSWPLLPTKRVEVATRAWTVVVPVTCRLPCTERRDPGVDVLIPMNELEELNVRTLPESSRQLPVALLKHPPESCMPLAKVEVAVELVILRTEACTPPPNVEVAVEVETRTGNVVVP